MSRGNLLIIAIVCLAINACSLTTPFVDRRREAGAQTPETLYIGKSTPEKPAICYNALTTPFAEVKKLAEQECRKQKTGIYAVPLNQTVFTCRVLVPNHFYFDCVK